MTRFAINTTLTVSMLFAAAATALPIPWSVTSEVPAVVGRPMTPVSYAGVARRTTRRAVVATSAAQSAYW